MTKPRSHRTIQNVLLFVLTAGVTTASLRAAGDALPQSAKLPDLRQVVPYHLDLYNGQKKEANGPGKGNNNGGGNVGNTVQILRFSSGIANTGDGPLELDPQFIDDTTIADANQNIYDSLTTAGNMVAVNPLTDAFQFHPEHHHWHLEGVSLFEVRKAIDDGKGGSWVNGAAASSFKETFCLIDYVPMSEFSGLGIERVYWDCFGQQGISVGWVDAYHHSTAGQNVDLTNVPNGIYYFVATANPDQIFLEKTLDNNTAWVSFRLFTPNTGKGERKIEIISDSGCSPEEPSLCGYSTNR